MYGRECRLRREDYYIIIAIYDARGTAAALARILFVVWLSWSQGMSIIFYNYYNIKLSNTNLVVYSNEQIPSYQSLG